MPFLGAVFYFFPSRKIKIIGVTGTNGKTTTVNMISDVLKEAGYKTAFLSSIKFQVGEEEKPNLLKMTMPGRMVIQGFLREAVRKKCHYVILEVSSEGIKQFRHSFIKFDTAVFTNLSPEHIESHKGFENYKKTKGKLFQTTQNIHVINLDDEHSDYFLKFSSKKKFCYSINKNSDAQKLHIDNCEFIKAIDIEVNNQGAKFTVNDIQFNLKILGDFNIYNALAAISVGFSLGIDLQISKKALDKFKTVPGRMEEVISEPFKVIVDYAVTPDALEKLYRTIKNTFSEGKIIAVLGACGGGRDKWKRPVLGKIAEQYCYQTIITNEDPYDEDPVKIMEEIASGFSENSKYEKILDRREAIKKALESAKEKDTVVITGKGCEPWMCVAKGKKIPWDDREIVLEEFEKIKS